MVQPHCRRAVRVLQSSCKHNYRKDLAHNVYCAVLRTSICICLCNAISPWAPDRHSQWSDCPRLWEMQPRSTCLAFLSSGLHHSNPLFFFLRFNFIYFWLRWVFVAARGLSLVAASGGYSSLRCAGFSLLWLLLLRSMGSRCVGFSSCGTWAQ